MVRIEIDYKIKRKLKYQIHFVSVGWERRGKRKGEWGLSEVLRNAFIINVMEKDLRRT